MAKKTGHTSAGKMNAEENVKLGDIYSAAKSTMGPTSYEKGYPHQATAIYPGKFHVGRGKPGGGSK